MPQPTQSSVHVNRPLTMISVAYMQAQDAFIADKVFPVIPVDKQSDLYYIYTKNDWFRDEAKPRAAATESAGGGYNLSTDSYKCEVFAFHKDVPDQVRANEDAPLNSDRDATEFVTNRLMLRREIQWASDFFTTGVWANDVTPSTLWSDFTSSDPIGDVRAGARTIKLSTGMTPNTLVLGYDVFLKLQDHPDIIDRYKYTSSEVMTETMIAKLFGVDRVLVAGGIKATNVEGETAATSFIHGKHALLAYVEQRPSLLQASAGYTFAWKGVSSGNGYTIGTKKFRMEHLEVDRIESQFAFDNKVIASDLGHFFNGAVA
jgi:hypothetical protein